MRHRDAQVVEDQPDGWFANLASAPVSLFSARLRAKEEKCLIPFEEIFGGFWIGPNGELGTGMNRHEIRADPLMRILLHALTDGDHRATGQR
jgi:hypothetical protein